MDRRFALLPGVVLAIVLLGFPALARSSPSAAPAAAPSGTAFTYQGELKQNGAPVNATCDFRFTAFDAPTSGSQVGTTQTVTGVAVTNGLFTAYPIDFGASAYTSALWLQVAAACPSGGGSYTTFPLQRLSPAPNAVFASGAGSADTATTATNFSGALGGDVMGGQSATTVGRLQGRAVANTAPTAGQVLKFDGTQWAPGTDNDTTYTAGSGLTLSGGQFSVSFAGSGSATTAARSDHNHVGQTWTASSGRVLSLVGNGSAGDALNVQSATTDVNAGAIKGVVTGATSPAVGVWGETPSTSALGAGLYGRVTGAASGTEGAKGVWGEGWGDKTIGVQGGAIGTNSIGVRGVANGTGGTGVSATAAATNAMAVHATADTGSQIAIKGETTQAGAVNSVALWGVACCPGDLAGKFDGNVQVNGTLSKTAGSFRIDHPLDPANQYLNHSFVESPDMLNIYNGNATLDANGEAWITLPAWFEALNADYRYQLTPIGGAAQNLHVGQKIRGNRFQIAGGTPGLEVSWQVTGIRNDPYAQQHRIPVEEPKPPEARGTYIFPEGYGQPSRQPAVARGAAPAPPVTTRGSAGDGR